MRTVCPCSAPLKEQCTFHFQLSLQKHIIILTSHCVITKSCRERNSRHPTGAPPALNTSTCSCCSSQHPLLTFPGTQEGESSCASLWVAQTWCGTHTPVLTVPHNHAGSCSAGKINPRVSYGSCSFCFPGIPPDSDHSPLAPTGTWHRHLQAPTNGKHPISSLLQDNIQVQSLPQWAKWVLEIPEYCYKKQKIRNLSSLWDLLLPQSSNTNVIRKYSPPSK